MNKYKNYSYEELLLKFSREILIVETSLKKAGVTGLYVNKNNNELILIEKTLSNTDKKTVLLEEYGHYKTSTGNILNLQDIQNIKQERRALEYSIDMFFPIEVIDKALSSSCDTTSNYEIAENLDVSCEYLEEIYNCHKRKERI